MRPATITPSTARRTIHPTHVSNLQSEQEAVELDGQPPPVPTHTLAHPHGSAVHNAIPLEEENELGATLQEVLEKLSADGDEEKALDKLADIVANYALKGATDEHQLEFKQQFKKTLREGLHNFKYPESLTADEKEVRSALMEAVAKIVVPSESTWGQRIVNNVKSTGVAGSTGFFFITAVVKIISNFILDPSKGPHFMAAGGAMVLFLAEVMTGSYRAQDRGYGAADSAAYQKIDQTNARIMHLELELKGMEANPATPQEEKDKLSKKIGAQRLVHQAVVFDCLTRELGHEVGLKADTDLPDVPKNTLLSWMRSSLTRGENNAVCLPDGKVVFHVLNNKGDVKWAQSGTQTNLLTDQVPTEDLGTFNQAKDLLFSAAHWRGFLLCDAPIHIFDLPYVFNALGPYLFATAPDQLAAKVGDTLIGTFTILVGTFLYISTQDYLNSRYAGIGKSAGKRTEAVAEQHELAKFEMQALKARLEQATPTMKRLKEKVEQAETQVQKAQTERDSLGNSLNRLETDEKKQRDKVAKIGLRLNAAAAKFKDYRETGNLTLQGEWAKLSEAEQKLQTAYDTEKAKLTKFETDKDDLLVRIDVCDGQLQKFEARLQDHQGFLAMGTSMYEDIVKDFAAAKQRADSTSSRFTAMWTMMKDNLQGMAADPYRTFAKLIGYSACYITLGEVVIPAAAKAPLPARMAGAGLGGPYMCMIFMLRNLVLARGIGYALHGAKGGFDALSAMLRKYPEDVVTNLREVVTMGKAGEVEGIDGRARPGYTHWKNRWDAAVLELEVVEQRILTPTQAKMIGGYLSEFPDEIPEEAEDNLAALASVTATLPKPAQGAELADLFGFVRTDAVLKRAFGREQATANKILEALRQWAAEHAG